MQNIDHPAFCQPCQKPTQHQIQYRSDPDFIGRVLVCENYGQRELELHAQERAAKTVDKNTRHVADGHARTSQENHVESRHEHRASRISSLSPQVRIFAKDIVQAEARSHESQ